MDTGRCGWIFAYLCHLYGPRDEWLAASRSCLDFLEEHCVISFKKCLTFCGKLIGL